MDFCQAFYNLSEIDAFSGLFSGNDLTGRDPKIKANYVIQIPPERLKVATVQGGGEFEVPIPHSHLGANRSVQARLISPFRTPDMIGACDSCFPALRGKRLERRSSDREKATL